MNDSFKIPVFEHFKKNAHLDLNSYEKNYDLASKNPEIFWEQQGKRIDWITPYNHIKDVKWSNNEVEIKWFYDGTLNACYNCIDRHLINKSEQIAIIWEGDDPNESQKITYKELHKNVCKFSNVMKNYGVKKR